MTGSLALFTAKVPHLLLTVLLAMAVSGVIAMLEKRNGRERLNRAGYLFVGCVACVVAGGWAMYLVNR